MPEPEGSNAPIIVIKKKGGHGGHHGGAWKVAYADFVTAMMALFIVLWLLNTNEKVRKAVEGYFKDPTGTGKQSGTAVSGKGESFNTMTVNKDNMGELKQRLEQAMKSMPKFAQMKDNVELSVTNEGLRVELLETEKGMFFELGNAHPTERGQELLERLAEELSTIPNKILIEGHTDAKPYAGEGVYSNWELSSDRANSARRLMQTKGLRATQVAQVRGFADQQLRMSQDPTNASNRRISVIVQYLAAPPAASASNPPQATASNPPQAKPAAPPPSAAGNPASAAKSAAPLPAAH
jgi:chemotaxis protein MotB